MTERKVMSQGRGELEEVKDMSRSAVSVLRAMERLVL